MSSPQQLLFLVGSGLGVAILYKLLLGSHSKSDTKESTSVVPEIFDGYGDDQMTFIGGYHAQNRLGPYKARLVTPDLAHIIVNNAVYEATPSQLIAQQHNEPPVQFVSEYF